MGVSSARLLARLSRSFLYQALPVIRAQSQPLYQWVFYGIAPLLRRPSIWFVNGVESINSRR